MGIIIKAYASLSRCNQYDDLEIIKFDLERIYDQKTFNSAGLRCLK